MKGTREFYDKTAKKWEEQGYAEDATLCCMKSFTEKLPEHARILDLCCGTGYESMRLKKLGYDMVGIDFSEESLLIARKHNPEIPFYEGDLLSDYSSIGKVDAVMVIAGLVHIEANQLPLAFARMFDVVKDGGKVLLSIREGIGKMEDGSLRQIDGEEYDRNFIAHTLEELKEAAAGKFCYECELESDLAMWHYYLFQKIEDKTVQNMEHRVCLKPMTRELFHSYYQHYQSDPDIYAENFTEYQYNEAKVEQSFLEQSQNHTRVLFAVCLPDQETPIGELKLKYIDWEKKECSMGIALTINEVKNKGYGTEAERLGIDYAFRKLGMKAMNTDAILKNKRSQHVMEKIGFQYVREDEMFRYYRMEREDYFLSKKSIF